MKILKRLGMWRRGRGFGIHSPLAYEIIRLVMGPEGRVSYSQADSLVRRHKDTGLGWRRRRHMARLLTFLKPAVVSITGEAPDGPWHRFVQAVLPGCSVNATPTPRTPLVVILDDSPLPLHPDPDGEDIACVLWPLNGGTDTASWCNTVGRALAGSRLSAPDIRSLRGPLALTNRHGAAIALWRRGLSPQLINVKF